jgi:hypothetical protein
MALFLCQIFAAQVHNSRFPGIGAIADVDEGNLADVDHQSPAGFDWVRQSLGAWAGSGLAKRIGLR